LKNDTLASLLFRVIRSQCTGLINALETAFPARRGSYLLGTRQIGYFTPNCSGDLALNHRFGNRTACSRWGRVSAMLPHARHDLVR